ncbi:hypothetical protein [Rhodococcoides fascians]|uniref:hypothetical protein n=1 Tax=Rhodococcoides fascians TaxID=1828 RepID=UPI0012D2ED54|nr:hypothetical protein [Rhodococcus fascians]
MPDPVELILTDLTEKYTSEPASDAFTRLYTDEERFGPAFASFHERLTTHFVAINDRAKSTHHYWADNSRELIALIDEVYETIRTLRTVGFDIAFHENYDTAVQRCRPWLSSGGGSTIPDDFQP